MPEGSSPPNKPFLPNQRERQLLLRVSPRSLDGGPGKGEDAARAMGDVAHPAIYQTVAITF
jgi:hypothetical protein